ncbi:ribonuclease P protein subunit p30 [Mayamaea pseudoterrestris]|nr:ribonuclease P protein subunit p30 [Mayamaea pseudoterrestris]
MGRGRSCKRHRFHKPRAAKDVGISLPPSSSLTWPSFYSDLYVPLPKSDSSSAGVSIQQLIDRFESIGFAQIALTHTIYGPPKVTDDSVDHIQRTLFKRKGSSDNAKSSVHIIYRLHAVIENLSDVGLYTIQQNKERLTTAAVATEGVLKQFDLVSIAPRNDAVFSTACSTATAAEIITLDYTTTPRGNLPFRITRSNVKAVIARNAVFEIPIAAACLNRHYRKGLIQTCRMLQSASLGLKPKIIVSSGVRRVLVAGSNNISISHDATNKNDANDAGALAICLPSDLINVVHAVLGWETKTAIGALSTSGMFAVNQGRRRRYGNDSLVVGVSSIAPQLMKMKSDLTADAGKRNKLPADGEVESVPDILTLGKVEDATAGEDGYIVF